MDDNELKEIHTYLFEYIYFLFFIFSWKYDLNKTCSVYLNNELVGVGEGSSKKACKELAAKEALQKLQGLCYTIRVILYSREDIF